MSFRSPLDNYYWKLMSGETIEHVKEIVFTQDKVLIRRARSRHYEVIDYPKTELDRCAVCKKLHPKKRLLSAYFPYNRNSTADEDFRSWSVCIGCYQMFNRIHKLAELHRELSALIRKLQNAKR